MPELPEVETIKNDLRKKIRGKQFSKVLTDWPKMFTPRFSVVKKKIIGQKIKSINRRGKLLILKLSGGEFLLVHLKMTGQLVYLPPRGKMVVGGHPIENVLDPPNRFTHASFYFKGGGVLHFNDTRKFGYLKLVKEKELNKILKKFGVEPLSAEFTLERFKKILKSRPQAKIKQLLMEQTLIAGIGNIYADEACFYAGVKPARRAGLLKQNKIKKLYQGIRNILRLAIEKRGTSFNTYIDSAGRQGNFVPLLKVYGRGEENCKKCGRKLKKIKLAGRGTVFCVACQK